MSEWRDIPGWEGVYQVSRGGQVRSLDRRVARSDGWTQYVRGKILEQSLTRDGYWRVSLWSKGKSTQGRIHRLLAQTFLADTYFDGAVVCHNDGSRTNNAIENLRWGSLADNAQDRLQHGNHPTAHRTHCSAGHEYTPENLRVAQLRHGGSARQCRACDRIRDKKKRLHTAICESCGVEFTRPVRPRRTVKTCSIKCRNELGRKTRTQTGVAA